MFRNCVFLGLLSLLIFACSLRSEDVLLEIRNLSVGRDYYAFDEKYILATKKLRERNDSSLHAHVAYIEARRGSKAMIAEYQDLLKKKNKPFYEYLSLRAEMSGLSYKQKSRKTEILEKLEAIVNSNKELEEEGKYDLCQIWGFDKKKKAEFSEELLKKRPNYLPYQRLYSSKLKANDKAKEIVEFCESGVKGSRLDLDLCMGLEDLNETNAKDLLPKRDELVKTIIQKSLQSKDKEDWRYVYSLVTAIEENEGRSGFKNEFIEKVLKKEPKWIPYQVYYKYYGDILYKDFEVISRIGKINKKLDFKERVKNFEELLSDSSLSNKLKADIHANIGYAFLNPANEDKEKAYKHFTMSHKLSPGSSYLISSLLNLILDLNKDPDIGLMLIEEALDPALKRIEEMGTGEVAHTDFLFGPFEGTIAHWYSQKGRLLLAQKKEQDAKIAFLTSFKTEESEVAAYFLGKLYSKSNPLLALEFLGLSLKNKSEDNPLKDEFTKDRDQLLKTIFRKYYSKEPTEETLLALYKDKNEEEKEELHPFLGKDLLTQEIDDFRGGKFDWKKLEGKKVILSFWATWCTPCFQEMAVLNKIQKEGKLKNLKIVGVCTDGISQKRKVKKILEEGGIDFEILLDDGTFRDKYLVSGIPSMFFLNEKSKFIKQKTGYSPKLEQDIFKIFK